MVDKETKILEMQFENRQFEKNIAKSTKSVEELKEAMDFEETSKGLDKFSKMMEKLNFSGLESNLQKLTDKFTGLGDAGEYVLSRIRYAIESTAQQMEYFIKSMTVSQIPVGQAKYDQLNKAVMTIISNNEKMTEDQAYGTMERVMEYTKQTSHDFSTMVGQISNLTSIGMGLDEAERLVEGIGNAATFAGGSAQQAAMSMGVLSKALSGSFLGYEQFLQLNQTSRVITEKWRKQALEAAEAVGTLKKKNDKLFVNVKGQKAIEVTVQNLEQTLRSRWLTTEVLKKIYENYEFGETLEDLAHPEKAVDSFGKTAFLTGQRALSFADAMNAIKESVSGGWMNTFRLLFGDVTEAAEHFTNIADSIIEFVEKIQDFRNDVLGEWARLGGRGAVLSLLFGGYEDNLYKDTYGFLDMLKDIGKTVYDGFVDFMMLFGDPVDRMNMKKNPNYFKAWLGVQLKSITEGAQNFMKRIQSFLNDPVEINGRTTTRLEIFHNMILGIAGGLKIAYDIITEVKHLIESLGADLSPSLDYILLFLADLGAAIYDTADGAESSSKIKKFFEDLHTTLKPITDGLNELVLSVTEFLRMLLGLDEDNPDRTKALDGIGKALLFVSDIVGKIAGPILEFLASVINLITELFAGGVTQEKFENFGKSLAEAFKTMLRSFTDNLPESLKGVGNWIKDLFGLWEKEGEGNEKSFASFLHRLFTGGFSSIGEFISEMTQGFSLKKAIENGFGFTTAFNFLNTVAGWFKGTNLYGVIMAFLGVVSLGTLWRLLSAAKKAIKTVTEFFDDVGGNLKQGFTGEYEWFGERLLRIAKSIALFVLSIMILGSMDTGRLIQGIIGLGVALGMMFGFYWLMTNKLKASMGQQAMVEAMVITMTAAIVAIALALSVLSLALIPLSLDPKRMITAVLGLLGMVVVLGGFFVIMLEKMDKFTFSIGGGNQWMGIAKMAVMMLALVAAIDLLVVGISALMVAVLPLSMIGWGGVFRAILAVGGMLAAFGAFIVIMLDQMDTLVFKIGGAGKGWSGIAKAAAMLLMIVGAIDLLAVGLSALVVAITPLAAIGWGGMIRAIIGIGGILAVLGTFIVIMINQMDNLAFTIGGSKKGQWSGMAKMGAMMLILAASTTLLAVGIGALVLAITPLAMMSWGGFVRAMAGLGIVLLELGLMIKFISGLNVGGNTVSLKIAGLAAFALSIGILIFSLIPLAMMSWESMIRALVGLGVVLAELVGFMWLAARAKISNIALGGFIAFALSMVLLMNSLTPLANMSLQGYLQAIFGLGAVLLELLFTMAILKALKPTLGEAASSAIMLIGIALTLVLVGIALNEIKDVPWQTILAFAAGLSLLIAAIAIGAAIAKAAGIAGILLMVAGLAAVLGVIALMAPLVIKSISGGLRDAAADLVIMSDLIGVFSSNMSGVDEGGIDKAGKVMDKMLALFGKLFGFKFAGGNATAFNAATAQLLLAMDEIVKFEDRVNQLSDDGGTEKAGHIIEEVRKLFDGPLSEFEQYYGMSDFFYSAIFNLGSAFDYFDSMTKNLTDPSENSGLGLIQALADTAPNIDTIYKMDLDKLKTQLAELGGAMIIYAKGAESVNGGEITEDTDVGGAIILLQKISESLAKEGGFAIPDNMPKDDELTEFGVELAALAGALVAFEEAGQGLGTGTEQALKTLDFFADLKERLQLMPNLGTDLGTAIDAFKSESGEFIRQDELTIFGEDIAKLGSAMAFFAESTQVVDQETGEVKPIDFSKATDAMESIVGLKSKLPKLGGVLKVITGRKETLTELAGEIESLGTALNEFYNSTTVKFGEDTNDIKPMDFTAAIDFLNSVGDLQTKLPKVREFSLESLFANRQMTVGEFSGQLVELGSALKQMTSAINGDGDPSKAFDPKAAKSAITVLNEAVVPFMNTMSRTLPEVDGLGRAIGQFFTGHVMTISELGDQLGGLGKGLGEMGKGLSEGKWASGNTGANEALAAIDSLLSIMTKVEQLTMLTGSTDANVGNLRHFLDELVFTSSDSTKSTAIQTLALFMSYLSDEISEFYKTSSELGVVAEQMNVFKIFAEGLNALTNADTTISWEYIGHKLTDSLAKSISSGVVDVTTAVATMMSSAYTTAENPGVSWNVLGANVVLGIAEGIKTTQETGLFPVIEAMMQEAYDRGRRAIDSNSPSRLFMQLGEYMGEGTAIGLKNTTGEVGENAEAMGEVALEKARAMVALISTVMAEDMNAQPTISPVLDLTNLNDGMRSFRDGLGGYGVNLDTTASAARAGRIGTSAYADENAGKPDYSGLYERIDMMSAQMAQMGKSIQQMKIVLNTGALVGGVSDGIDLELGRRGFYAGRNN